MATKRKAILVTDMSDMNVRKVKLKRAVRFFYDLQKLRIQAGNRNTAQDQPAILDEEDKEFIGLISDKTKEVEKLALNQVAKLLKGIPIYERFLKDVRGIGPTMAGVIISEISIEKAQTVSGLWAWCGLAVRDGVADRLKRGEKARYNPFLKSKIVRVAAECLIKSKSEYTRFYYDYKHRKATMRVPVCMACHGAGVARETKKKIIDSEGKSVEITDPNAPKAGSKCRNCNGTGKDAPWGKSDLHRHNAAMRYMMKMFLIDLYLKWRALEGLPVSEPYAAAKLGIRHGDHATHPANITSVPSISGGTASIKL